MFSAILYTNAINNCFFNKENGNNLEFFIFKLKLFTDLTKHYVDTEIASDAIFGDKLFVAVRNDTEIVGIIGMENHLEVQSA